MRLGRIFTILLVAVIALGIAGVIFLRNLNLDDYKDEIAAVVKEITERDLTLRGHISFSLSLKPTITVRDVALANAPWGEAEHMLEVDRLLIQLDLLRLVIGTFDTSVVTLSGGRLFLERATDGRANWRIDLDQQDIALTKDYLGGPFPYLHAAYAEQLKFAYTDRRSAYRLQGELTGMDAQVDAAGQMLQLQLNGHLKDRAFTGKGAIAALKTLHAGGSSPLELSLRLDEAVVKFDGTVGTNGAGDDLDVRFDLTASHLDNLAPLLDVELPDLGTARAGGRIVASDKRLALSELDAHLGESDLRGSIEMIIGDTPSLSVDLSSDRLDITPLLEDRAGVPNASQSTQSEVENLFSDAPLQVPQLPSFDAGLKLSVAALVAGDLSFSDISLRARSSHDEIEINPFTLTYKGSKVSGPITFKPGPDPQIAIKFLAQNFDLGTFLKEHKVTDLVEGDIDVGFDVRGQGKSVHEIVASLNGTAGVVMGKGRIPSRYVDLIAAGLLRSLMPWKKGANETKIKCALGQFVIKNGKLKTKSLLFDTKNITMTGHGTLDLRTEKINLTLLPRPKDPALLSLATGLRVTGTLLDTKISLDPASVAKEIAEGAVGVLLFGPAGILIPFASLGAGHHHPCVNDLQKMFGSQAAKQLDSDGGDGAQPVPDPSEPPATATAVPIPNEVLLPMRGSQVGAGIMRSHLDDLGFTNIGTIDKEGAIFHVEAQWQGRPVKLRIDADLGTIEQVAK